MLDTANTDLSFGPSGDESQASPITPVKHVPNYWPVFVVVIVFVAMAIGICIGIGIHTFDTPLLSRSPSTTTNTVLMADEPRSTSPEIGAIESQVQSTGRALQAYPSYSNQWCGHDETVCTTTITDTPIETLQKLVAAIPKGNAKLYTVRLAVVPVETAQ